MQFQHRLSCAVFYIWRDFKDPLAICYPLRTSRRAPPSSASPPDLLAERLKRSRVVIVDLGNACWTYKHFSQDIQTRQYWRKGVLEQFDWDEWKTQPPMCGAGLVLRERLAPPFAGACRKLESY